MLSTARRGIGFAHINCPSPNAGTGGMSQQMLWEDMAPLEKLAAIRELAEQVKALRGDCAPRRGAEESRPIQLRPSVCSRLGQAFLLSAANPLDHPAAHFNLSQYPAWNFRPSTETYGACSFGDEKPRQQKRTGLLAKQLRAVAVWRPYFIGATTPRVTV